MSGEEIKTIMKEMWECNKCDAPCVVIIIYSDDKLPGYLKGNERFCGGCICGSLKIREDYYPEWHKIVAAQDCKVNP